MSDDPVEDPGPEPDESCLLYKTVALTAANALSASLSAALLTAHSDREAAEVRRAWWDKQCESSPCAKSYTTLVENCNTTIDQATDLSQRITNLINTINAIDCTSATYVADIAAAQAELVACSAAVHLMNQTLGFLHDVLVSTRAECLPPS